MYPRPSEIHSPQMYLKIRLTESQIGYLAHRFPDADPEDAIIALIEQERIKSLRRATRRVRVLHPSQHDPSQSNAVEPPEIETALPTTDTDNPIGILQEYCQKKRLPMPDYSFEAHEAGFRCTAQAFGLSGAAIAPSKKQAKTQAATDLLQSLSQRQIHQGQI